MTFLFLQRLSCLYRSYTWECPDCGLFHTIIIFASVVATRLLAFVPRKNAMYPPISHVPWDFTWKVSSTPSCAFWTKLKNQVTWWSATCGERVNPNAFQAYATNPDVQPTLPQCMNDVCTSSPKEEKLRVYELRIYMYGLGFVSVRASHYLPFYHLVSPCVSLLSTHVPSQLVVAHIVYVRVSINSFNTFNLDRVQRDCF